jgi:hypothetical protein
MFLDESAFDLEDNDTGFSRRTAATESRFSNISGKISTLRSLRLNSGRENNLPTITVGDKFRGLPIDHIYFYKRFCKSILNDIFPSTIV